MTLPRPPAHVQPFVDALDVDGAIDFLLRFGGAEMVFPANPRGESMVAKAMGMNAAKALSDLAQRVMLPRRMPTAKPWIAQVMHAKGLSQAEIARRLHASDVAVRRWIAKGEDAAAPKDPNQLRLF